MDIIDHRFDWEATSGERRPTEPGCSINERRRCCDRRRTGSQPSFPLHLRRRRIETGLVVARRRQSQPTWQTAHTAHGVRVGNGNERSRKGTSTANTKHKAWQNRCSDCESPAARHLAVNDGQSECESESEHLPLGTFPPGFPRATTA